MTATNGPNFFGDLHADLDRSRRELEGTVAAISEIEDELTGQTFIGADSKKMVTVTLTRDGLVDQVTISPQWRTRITPTALGPAALSAYRAARASLAEEVAAAFADAGLDALSEQVRRRSRVSDNEDEGTR
ncbi:YbaB/EbfC family nucleoid-associated protein [Actinopolymorpha pittospori]|uniref:DNA-binding protein YbaB n=1 Tax=Actinopolymorpha pittospori TaxID=648752 RepID=A0A927N3J5_9ACTN|nr:YbaB/EbfC family nucleoid-associated protein [Actinopolymorpha pittospori]MBE1611484.1 DNA-binding protein YbaB [Actinopolymorpha pittospori]